MATNTTNYSLIKPTVGGDADDWGGYLNTNMDTLESLLSGSTALVGLKFGDNAKAKFGAGDDLEIYHDGTNSVIADTGTGALKFQASSVVFEGTDGNDQLYWVQNAQTTLHYDNSAKLSTTSTGVDITGDLTVSGTITASAFSGIYPVGSIYINATDGTNPATLLGFGTWVAFGAGRVPVGFDSTDTSFDTAEETGGSKDAVVVSHSHTVTDPGHTHNISLDTYSGGGGGPAALDVNQYFNQTVTKTTQSATTGITVNSAGSSGTNANLQPYITVYMWKRTA